jgi:hypothetical protein
MGTYNFYNPESKIMENDLILDNGSHRKFDVSPYNILGNSSDDSTTENQRIWRFLEAVNP